MFALMVWINDSPVTGNIQKLTSIVEPRKPFEDYKEGEEVKAKCQGFGIVSGVIGKIVSDEAGKKDLEDILKGERFSSLVKELISTQRNRNDQGTTNSTSTTDIVVSASPEGDRGTKTTKKRGQKTGGEVNERKKKNDGKSNQDLSSVAAVLELTQLNREVSEKLTETAPAVETAPRFEETVVCRPVPTRQAVDMDLYQLRQEQLQSSQRIAQLENNLSWMWNQMQQMQCTMESLQSSLKASLAVSAAPPPSISEHPTHSSFENQPLNEPDASASTSRDESVVIGGYTLAQLESKIDAYSEFSKASVLLFRMVFKEEEYRGKSLTGAPGKEAVDRR